MKATSVVEPEGSLAVGSPSMAMGRPKAELTLSEDERRQLTSLARSRSLPAGLVQRASLVLACAEGAPNSAVARRFGVTNASVGKWRQRFVADRSAGLHDELRPGKPRSIDDARIAGLLTTTLHPKPKDGATHWSVRGLAAETGISKTSVHRFLQVFGLQPHRQDTFKLSTDPFFVEKLRDVVGLYLNHARQGAGPVRRREKPGAGARAHPAVAAHGLRLCRGGDPRLSPSRHHHAVRGPRPARWQPSSPSAGRATGIRSS